MKHRDFYLDNICGILILYMIFILHCGDIAKSHSVLSSLLGKLLFSFMMPWFFFKSGMFADKAKFDIKRNFKKFISPYILFTIYGWVIMLLYYLYLGIFSMENLFINPVKQIILYGGIEWNMPLWFLLGLFLVKMLFSFFKIYKFKWSFLYVALCCYLLSKVITIPYFIGFTTIGLFYFICGDLLRNKQFNKYIFLIALIFFAIALFTKLYSSFDIRLNQVGIYDMYLVDLVVALSGIILFNNLSFVFLNRNIPVLSFVGRNSMIFYTIHYPMMILIYNLINENELLNSYLILCILLAGYLMIGILFSKSYIYQRIMSNHA